MSSTFKLCAALICYTLISVFITTVSARADITDPFDPFDRGEKSAADDEAIDQAKSAEDLINEATLLLDQEHLLDARTKLLRALKKDPKAYRAHMMLSGYYMVHVGHYRLSLKYIKQAQSLFEAQNGPPPYKDPIIQATHAQILYFLSQVKLNLDNYQGALDVLDEFTRLGYYGAWYPGSRAWILMKLGRVEEAIRVARLGVLAGAEAGRTLNMLGILLSMHGERQSSLDVFRQAITYELSLGQMGEPATPLNNSGEVLKEVFQEDKAESAWLRATSMPDGCEHVLPSLNLALLYLEQLNFTGAKRAMDGFETCIAQYPLRNGEEHKALVSLARGRIDLLTGHATKAIAELEASLENRQWFGKIGTDIEDLEAGAMISLAQAYRARNNELQFSSHGSWVSWLDSQQEEATNSLKSWWYMRRARQILTKDLNDLEDLQVRNTDSLIEYPSFGEVLAGLPSRLLKKKLDEELTADTRPEARAYYSAYLGENLLSHGSKVQGLRLLGEAMNSLRERYDDALMVEIMELKASTMDQESSDYAKLMERLFSLTHAAPRNYGLPLVVNFKGEGPGIEGALKSVGFIIDNSSKRMFAIESEYANNEYALHFSYKDSQAGTVRVKGKDIDEVVNQFADSVFSIDLK